VVSKRYIYKNRVADRWLARYQVQTVTEDCFEARFAVAPRVCLDNVISGSEGAIECAARFLGGVCSGDGRPLLESAA